MKYILYNIRNLARNEKFIFALILICVFVSSWILTFSYGLYENYHALSVKSDEEARTAHAHYVKDVPTNYGDIKAYLEALPSDLLNDASAIMCWSDIEYGTFEDVGGTIHIQGFTVSTRFTIKGGIYQKSSFIEEMWKNERILVSGDFFSDDDEMYGSNYAIVNKNMMQDPSYRKELTDVIIDDDTILLFGKEYKIIGITEDFGVAVPFMSVPAEAPTVRFLDFIFEKTLTRKKYKTLIDTANEVLPGKLYFPERELPDSDEKYVYHNIMLISVFIAVLTIINFAFLYNFILSKRKRQLAIMRICGCTAGRAVRICLGECCLLCVPVFLAGMLTFIPFMKHFLSQLFPYMEDSYSLWIYAAIFGIYFVIMLIIMGILLSGQIRKTLAEGRKEAA